MFRKFSDWESYSVEIRGVALPLPWIECGVKVRCLYTCAHNSSQAYDCYTQAEYVDVVIYQRPVTTVVQQAGLQYAPLPLL